MCFSGVVLCTSMLVVVWCYVDNGMVCWWWCGMLGTDYGDGGVLFRFWCVGGRVCVTEVLGCMYVDTCGVWAYDDGITSSGPFQGITTSIHRMKRQCSGFDRDLMPLLAII